MALDPRDKILKDEALYKGKPSISGSNNMLLVAVVLLLLMYNRKKK